jgi:hypothetical protein
MEVSFTGKDNQQFFFSRKIERFQFFEGQQMCLKHRNLRTGRITHKDDQLGPKIVALPPTDRVRPTSSIII